MLFRKDKTLLGLNIGSGYVKMVELKGSGSVFTLNNFGMAALPPDAIVDGTIMDTAAIVSALVNLAANLKVKKKRICTSISGHSVIVKKITLPLMDENTIEETIHQEATQHIPYDINDVNLDFQILGTNRINPENMDVILVAVKKDTINDYLLLVEEAGFVPVVVDVDTFALENSYEYNYEGDTSKIVALIDIGANLTCISILDDGVTCFSRNITSGSRLITEQLQKRLSLNYENAELLKMGCGDSSKTDGPTALGAINEAAFSLVNEIGKAIDFFHNSAMTEGRVEKIILSGGGAKTPGIVNLISKNTGIETEIINPFKNIIIPEKQFDLEYIKTIAPIAAVATGLALRKDEALR
ncbi:MAG: type IV pilus assembly protein PilM [Deltaproteobacteria bacterium]|nr:type IV pilus assembly protein PilM [Deltaproteobacteria bacterium]